MRNHCYQTGFVKNGIPRLNTSKIGPCRGGPPRGRTWFKVRIEVFGRRASVFIGSKKITSFTTHYQPGGVYGALALNGFQNIVHVKSLQARTGRSRMFEIC